VRSLIFDFLIGNFIIENFLGIAKKFNKKEIILLKRILKYKMEKKFFLYSPNLLKLTILVLPNKKLKNIYF
jgi:hypothetical protein